MLNHTLQVSELFVTTVPTQNQSGQPYASASDSEAGGKKKHV